MLSCRSALASYYQIQEHWGSMFLLHPPWHVAEVMGLSFFFPGTNTTFFNVWLFPLPLCIKFAYSFVCKLSVSIFLYIITNSLSSLGFPCGSADKESACNAGDLGLILGSGRSPGEGKLYPVQYSGLENSMDCIVHGVTKSWTRLREFHFHFHPH